MGHKQKRTSYSSLHSPLTNSLLSPSTPQVEKALSEMPDNVKGFTIIWDTRNTGMKVGIVWGKEREERPFTYTHTLSAKFTENRTPTRNSSGNF